MINLIPSHKKQAISYARRNAVLVRWLTILIIAALGLIVVALGCLFYIKQDIKSHETSINNIRKSLEDQNEEETLEELSDISSRLSLIVNVLSKEVVFSKLIPHIGSLMPDGAALNTLNLSRETEGGIDLSISARDYETASQVLTNLQASESLLFKGADANNIVCDGGNPGIYPCEVSIRAVITEDNPFLLLNQGNEDE